MEDRRPFNPPSRKPAPAFLYRPVFGISVILAYAAGTLIVVVSALVAIDIVLRWAGISFSFQSFELARYGFAISVGFGLAYTLMSRSHIRVDILYNAYPDAIKRTLDLIAIILMALVAVFLADKAVELTARSFRIGAASNTSIGIPLGIPQTLWAAGLIWFALVAIYLCVASAWQMLRRRFADVEAMIGNGGAEEIPELAHKREAENADRGGTTA